jgi:chromate reductase, NAD(P)H dehydrogenase (quinone)
MKSPRILALSGSLRCASFNQKLAAIAAKGAEEANAQVTLISLKKFPLPLFDEDLETSEGMPAFAKELKNLFTFHDGLIISSPEYNSGITAVLKNTIDWVSRVESKGEIALSAFKNKTAVILAASPGGFGGQRGLTQLRTLLENIGVTVMPQQVSISKAHEAFDANGELLDKEKNKQTRQLGAMLARHLTF